MKKILLPALALILPALAGAAKLPKQYTLEEKMYAFSYVWSEIKYNFVFIDRIDFNPDSLYVSYLPRIAKTRNDVEFFDEMKRFVARFDDGHTAFYPPEGWAERVLETAPISVYELGGRYYLSRIYEASGLDSLALGAEIVRIEGVPTQQYVREHYFPVIAVGSKTIKYHLAGGYIGTGLPGSYFDAELQYRDGRTKAVHIKRDYRRLAEKGRLGRLWSWAAPDTGRHDAEVELDWPAERIARLNFFSFDEASFPLLDSLLLTVVPQQADGLIIDLRSCPGGSGRVANYLEFFVVDADTVVTAGSRVRINNGYGRAQGSWRPEYADFYNYHAYETYPGGINILNPAEVVKCPIVILTSPVTVSACEDFLIDIYELPNRPPIVGQRTSGSTGAPLVLDLPHGAWARICTREMRGSSPTSRSSRPWKTLWPGVTVRWRRR